MTIVVLSFDFPEYSIQLANALAREDSVHLLLPEKLACDYPPQVSERVDLDLFRCPRIRYPSNIAMVWRVFRRIAQIKPDVVHLIAGHPWFNMCLPVLNKRYCLVSTIHDITPHTGDALTRRMPLRDYPVKHSACLIVHGERLREDLLKRYRFDENRLAVVPHGALTFYTGYGKQDMVEEETTILFFGRIWPYKGLRYLIEAEPLISAKIPDITIIIAGTGENFDQYEKIMADKGRYTVYNEYIPNEKAADLFRKATVVALPYIDGSQSGIVAMAYAFKKPVVATDVGSISEVVKHGETGFVVPPGDSEKLAEALVEILKSSELRSTMAANISSMTDGILSWRSIAAKTEQVYRKALAQ